MAASGDLLPLGRLAHSLTQRGTSEQMVANSANDAPDRIEPATGFGCQMIEIITSQSRS
jgi:hypothetical protein